MNTKAEIVEPKANFIPKFTREDHRSLAEFLLLLAEIEKKINKTYGQK